MAAARSTRCRRADQSDRFRIRPLIAAFNLCDKVSGTWSRWLFDLEKSPGLSPDGFPTSKNHRDLVPIVF